MTKVTSKKRKKVIIKLDPDMGHIIWEVIQPHGRQKIISIENIKEMRSGADARYYREQFQLSQIYEDCWLTIIYILDGNYKTLHLIAPSVDVFRIWDTSLRRLYAIRRELMTGLGNFEMRQALWEKQYWKGSQLDENEKLRFGEVEKLCKRMNIHSSSESLFRLFTQADVKNHGYLDFDDFRRFVKLLKGRPEVDRLYKKLVRDQNGAENVFDYKTFEHFMREVQKSKLGHAELQELFEKYATYGDQEGERPTSPNPTNRNSSPPKSHKHSRKALSLFLSLDAFTSFLLSADNAAFLDQHGKVWHDMTKPLSDYYIASSHNTYLVGHQLVGVSTIEGYIRALLHSCRSVEIDIYDGDSEPMVFHGKSFTSKVPLRQVCHAIIKYGFVASPYPIIISAEMHCSVPQQDMIAEILVEVFGDALVRVGAGLGAKPKVEVLPSPEELKGKILFKTKDVTALRQDWGEGDVFTETSGTSSASDSDALLEFGVDGDSGWSRRLSNGMSGIGILGPGAASGASVGGGTIGITGTGVVSPVVSAPKTKRSPSIQAARTVIQRVRHAGKPSSSNGSGSGGGGVSISGNGSTSGGNILKTTGPLSQSPPSDTLALSPDLLSPKSMHTPSYSTKSTSEKKKPKQPKISPHLQSLLVYTIGVKFQGINKKITYAPEHMFSLSETTANKLIGNKSGGGNGRDGGGGDGDRTGMYDLIKHCRTHLVRIYPKGWRVASTNYEPHRYWSAGAQLVAMNWQTFDLGYMINHAMFQRNGRSGYVLKPRALRSGGGGDSGSGLGGREVARVGSNAGTRERTLGIRTRTSHSLDLTIISAQQLPRLKDSSGREMVEKPVFDPYVEVTVYVPDWTYCMDGGRLEKVDREGEEGEEGEEGSVVPGSGSGSGATTGLKGGQVRARIMVPSSARSMTYRTSAVKNNGFNPIWEEKIRIPFDCVGDMWDLIFVRFVVRQEDREDENPLAIYCVSLGSLGHGYRHLPLHDAQLSQYLFSTLFVKVQVKDTS